MKDKSSPDTQQSQDNVIPLFGHQEEKPLDTYAEEEFLASMPEPECEPLQAIDRSVLIIKRKKAFLEWLKGLPDPVEGLTMKALNIEPTTFLIPAFECVNEETEFIKSFCPLFFQNEMSAWWDGEDEWIRDFSWKNFKKYFSYQVSSVAVDMLPYEVRKEGPALEI